MKVENFVPEYYTDFKRLFCAYYQELDCEDNPLHLFEEYVIADIKAGLLRAALALDGGAVCGFIIFQTDDVLNDWNFKEGFGDVREIYVVPEARGRGAGKALITFAESALKEDGATAVYTLPTDESERFFIYCGYEDGGEYCAELDCKVFIKDKI